jgi:hypothetical protein
MRKEEKLQQVGKKENHKEKNQQGLPVVLEEEKKFVVRVQEFHVVLLSRLLC